jgi:hypothetical protein
MISDIFRGEYRLRGRSRKTLYSEYWLPSSELMQDPSLRLTVERRVHEELARYFRQLDPPAEPPFHSGLIRGQWFTYDWNTRTFSGAPPNVPPPDERMRE